MDFHAAVETFAEAWVAAKTHPASERQVIDTDESLIYNTLKIAQSFGSFTNDTKRLFAMY